MNRPSMSSTSLSSPMGPSKGQVDRDSDTVRDRAGDANAGGEEACTYLKKP